MHQFHRCYSGKLSILILFKNNEFWMKNLRFFTNFSFRTSKLGKRDTNTMNYMEQYSFWSFPEKNGNPDFLLKKTDFRWKSGNVFQSDLKLLNISLHVYECPKSPKICPQKFLKGQFCLLKIPEVCCKVTWHYGEILKTNILCIHKPIMSSFKQY